MRRVPRDVNRAEEWVQSINDERALNNLVVLGILPNRVIDGWRPVVGENFPTPHSDELVVLKITSSADSASQFILFSMG